MVSDQALLNRLYDRFNARDMEAVIAVMHPDIVWANGMEGGYVDGHQGVREYSPRQWAAINPHVEPTTFATGPNGETVVEVHQTVRDLAAHLLSDKVVSHTFRIADGLIRRSNIRIP